LANPSSHLAGNIKWQLFKFPSGRQSIARELESERIF